MMVNVYISAEKKIKVNKKLVHKIIGQLKNELDFKILSLIVNFVSSETILEINKKYLTHNYTTDIITFNYSNNNILLEGEVFISVSDVFENSEKYKCSFQNEILRVIIHGVLHLLGYNDIERSDKIKMKKLENNLVKHLDILLKDSKIILS
jgi:rRNA maturation RNase YbeY